MTFLRFSTFYKIINLVVALHRQVGVLPDLYKADHLSFRCVQQDFTQGEFQQSQVMEMADS